MNRYYLIFLLAIIAWPKLPVYAQEPEFWGMTPQGGNDFGVIFKTDGNGENFRVVHVFAENPGRNPSERLIEASNGKLYGVNKNGGEFGDGVLFEYVAGDTVITKLADLGANTIGSDASHLIEASNGKLYGTGNGGVNKDGTIYEYDFIADTARKLIDFERATTGRLPRWGFIEGINGKLYNATGAGGTYDLGTIFEFDPTGNVFTKLYDLKDSINGRTPYSLVQASNGTLYGVTKWGGINDAGVLFSFDLASKTYTKLQDFSLYGLKDPYSRMTEAPNGKLYGVTINGGFYNEGVMYEYDVISDTLIIVLDYGPSPGGLIASQPILANNGKLYGVTSSGGAYDNGTLYEFDPVSKNFQELFHFNYSNKQGNDPWDLMQASNGRLYGVCSGGGIENNGVLFEYDLNSQTYTKKLNFWDISNGGSATGSLMRASNGKLYGLASAGGEYLGGVLFELDPVTEAYKVKHDFGGLEDGAGMNGKLVEHGNGKLYGMTISGGANNEGTIFEYDPLSGQYEKKVDLGNGLGSTPRGSLLLTSNGKLYGVTEIANGIATGVLFEYDPVTESYEILYKFEDRDKGFSSQENLIEIETNILYGLAAGGEFFDGVVFEFDLTTNTYTKKADFKSDSTGKRLKGSLEQAPNGKLYGLASAGGSNYKGTLFEYDLFTEELTMKVDFDLVQHGEGASGSLIRATNGKLYGMAYGGGTIGKGVLFEYNTATNEFIKKHEFDGWNGCFPRGNLLEINSKFVGINETKPTKGISVYPNPAADLVYVQFAGKSENVRINLINVHGAILLQKQIAAKEKITLDVSMLPAGVYLLELSSKQGTFIEKVVKH